MRQDEIIVPDLRLVPADRSVLGEVSALEMRGGWAPRDRSLGHGGWRAGVCISYVDSRQQRPVIARDRLETFLAFDDADPPLAWCLRRQRDDAFVAIALLAWGPLPTAEELPGRDGTWAPSSRRSARTMRRA